MQGHSEAYKMYAASLVLNTDCGVYDAKPCPLPPTP